IRQLLEDVKKGKVSTDTAAEMLKDLPFTDLGFAKIDNHREIRTGCPEVIYCAGKTEEQVAAIIGEMLKKGNNILATKAAREAYEAVKALCPEAEYHAVPGIITVRRKEITPTDTYIAVVTAGTSDIPVAEEAAVTAEMLGNRVERVFDVGVAGIHRLFASLDIITKAKVVIAVAGMEGALASIIGGLVDKPVIAVPTSVGYGASFGGLSALLAMLNSCACGTAVVNIDNGFGAGYLAGMINRLE
ncbi:MAG: nickel pincer cofactor biosynthesis protein LarB, partial [Deltaproteobacteria bacterium]|nr:nickel pincer cofactor biosynthesis protein LarB [Deltaproteobacteria bacterium]